MKHPHLEPDDDFLSIGPVSGVTKKVHVDWLVRLFSDQAIDTLLDRMDARSEKRVSLAERQRQHVDDEIKEAQEKLAGLLVLRSSMRDGKAL